MPGEAYDYLMAVVILGLIFSAAVVIVPSLSYVNLMYLEQQQLRNVALSVMKTILFDEGYPANWGSMSGPYLFNDTDVKRFGLALQNEPSLYVLDQDKVLRLANNPLGNISYQRVKDLLGLSGYGFSIIMRPLFKVDKYVSNPQFSGDQKTVTVTFNVNVSRYDGQPVPNAIVSTYMIFVVDANPPTTNIAQSKWPTDSLGRCQGSSQAVSTTGKIMDVVVFFKVTVGDRSTLVVQAQDTQEPNDIAKINIVGDNIVLTNPPVLPGPNAARWILNIQMYNFETSANLLNGSRGNEYKLTYGSGYGLWSGTFAGLDASEPSILILTFDAVGETGRTLVILVGPWGLWSTGGIIQLNEAPVSSGASVSVQRDVLISGMAYVAELRLWKTI